MCILAGSGLQVFDNKLWIGCGMVDGQSLQSHNSVGCAVDNSQPFSDLSLTFTTLQAHLLDKRHTWIMAEYCRACIPMVYDWP